MSPSRALKSANHTRWISQIKIILMWKPVPIDMRDSATHVCHYFHLEQVWQFSNFTNFGPWPGVHGGFSVSVTSIKSIITHLMILGILFWKKNPNLISFWNLILDFFFEKCEIRFKWPNLETHVCCWVMHVNRKKFPRQNDFNLWNPFYRKIEKCLIHFFQRPGGRHIVIPIFSKK